MVYKNPMTSEREKFNDLHVRTYIAYGNTTDHKLYLEPEHKTQVEQADLKHAFELGALLIFNGTDYLVPLSMAANKVNTIGTKQITLTEGSTAVAVTVEWAAKASA